MIVVSDTSPLNYLVLCRAVDVLPRLYGVVYVPGAVISELRHPGAPQPVKSWLDSAPGWLVIRDPAIRQAPFQLDLGETSAILLAEELHADRILIDERPGYNVAKSRGLNAVGTLAVLAEAGHAGLLDLPRTLDFLESQTSFRMTPQLRALVLTLPNLPGQANLPLQ
jgi:predicted nucleic acid-binding protein